MTFFSGAVDKFKDNYVKFPMDAEYPKLLKSVHI